MKNVRVLILTGMLALLLPACPFNHYNFYTGFFPETTVNLGDINTEFDDYNSTAPTLGQTFPLCFSSNSGGRGGFDLYYVGIHKLTGENQR